MNTGEASQEPQIALDEVASRRALDAIRREALDGLLALPRVGMGVGGFLTGIRRENRIQILGRIEIPCTHARGPAFLLTSEELENARSLAATAEPLEVLGLYVSKTRGALEPGPADLEMLNALCPGVGRMILLVRPSTVEPVRATLFGHAQGERFYAGIEVPMDGAPDRPLDADRPPAPQPVPVPPPNLALQAVKMAARSNGHMPDNAQSSNEPVTPIAPVEERTADASSVPSEPAPAVSPQWRKETRPAFDSAPSRNTVLFREREERGSPRRSVLYTCGALALIAAAAVAALDILSPRPELALSVREENGALVFRWNRNAASGANRGRLLVNDAGRLYEFPLDAARIDAGFFPYRRKSDQISARLVLGDRSARAVFFGNSSATGK